MRVSIARLRAGILVLAGLLIAGLLSFFAYARWQLRHIGRDLPSKLGISVQQSTNGFTFSRSEGGHTSFTLHAAKMVQYKGGGHVALHDVSILLYGAAGAKPDRIYGNEFDYDPASGVVRANGAVQIDLEGPAGAGAGAPGSPGSQSTLHLQTADLVFNQKTGMATTPQRLEFRIAEVAGSAMGATFDARTGVLVLDHDVSFQSTLDGKPLAGRAGHAQYDRASHLLSLSQCSTDYASGHGSSDRAIVHFRPDGSAERVDAEGHVVMTKEARKIASERAQASLGPRSQPQRVVLEGGVLYEAQDGLRRLRGSAVEGSFSFDPQNRLRHAQLHNAVSIVEEEKAPPEELPRGEQAGKAAQPAAARDLEASQIDVDFATSPDRRPVARDLLAVGGARLNVRTFPAGSAPEAEEVQGDRLLFLLRNGASISSLRGDGHTRLTMLNPAGVKQTSTGDSLLMSFAPAAGAAAAKGNPASGPEAQLQSAEQQGNVVLLEQIPQQAPGAPGPEPVETRATARRATYDASTQLVVLEGDPHLHDPSGTLSAGTIQFKRGTGDATATGGIKATYRPAPGQPGEEPAVSFGGPEPLHAIADHARLDRKRNLIVFYGRAAADARLWQGADSISAPVLELSRAQGTLSAHSATGSGGMVVKAVLLDQGSRATPAGTGREDNQRGNQGGGQPRLLRVNSRSMVYSMVSPTSSPNAPTRSNPQTGPEQAGSKQSGPSQAIFRGGVLAEDPFGVLRTRVLDVTFESASAPIPASAPPGSAPGKGLGTPAGRGKQVEGMVAHGDVELEQPGRTATGEQLVYTSDGRFVLTGTRGAPPRLVDQVHGTVTGASLIFNDRDDSVIVSGGPSKATTETRTAK